MRILQALSLTTNQKRVLAKIVASPSPKVAADEISTNQNLVAARDQLIKLAVIDFNDGNAELTDKGRELAQEYNITDGSGGLGPDGEMLAYTDIQGKPTQQKQGGGQEPALGSPAEPNLSAPTDLADPNGQPTEQPSDQEPMSDDEVEKLLGAKKESHIPTTHRSFLLELLTRKLPAHGKE